MAVLNPKRWLYVYKGYRRWGVNVVEGLMYMGVNVVGGLMSQGGPECWSAARIQPERWSEKMKKEARALEWLWYSEKNRLEHG